jgi:hypothetical protein
MNLRILSATAVAATGLVALALPADAGRRHWFYGSYGAYDRGAVVEFGFRPGPRPMAPMPPAYYPGYPPSYPGPHPTAPEFYYEVAPGQFVPVYGNDEDAMVPDRNGNPVSYRPVSRAPMSRAPVEAPRRSLVLVPKPKSKPPVPQKVAVGAPNEPIVETDAPADKRNGPAISCARARQIVGDFGFTAIEPLGCAGKEYGFRAQRDGKDFEVRLSSLSGELIEVKRR